MFRRSQPDYTSIELVSQDPSVAINAPGTLISIREPTLGLRRRFLPTFAVILTTACAAAVWSLRLLRWKDSLGFFTFVTTHRVAIQVSIHILSSALTLLLTFGVCSTFNLATRSRFARRAVSIKTLRLWTLISQARVSFSIPLSSFLICAAFCITIFLPAWIWTGALTPQLTTFTALSNVTVPKTGAGAYPFLGYRSKTDGFNFECWNTTQTNGTFTSCPGLYESGALLSSAASATTIDGSPRNHSKFGDNSAYRYVGRSYGIGASVGLTVESPAISSLYGYNYTELGYMATVKCIYNSTSKWEITLQSCPDSADLPCSFYAIGCFPNSQLLSDGTCDPNNTDHYAQASYGPDGNVVAMGATNSDNVTDYYLSIATTPAYEQFNDIQCQFSFRPQKFVVNVSMVDTSIAVAPLQDDIDLEPRGLLRSKVLDALNVISMVQTTLYISTVGEALQSNVRNYMSWSTKSNGSLQSPNDAQVLAAVTASVEAMADDILQSFAAAALTQPDAYEQQEVLFTAGGVEIGEYPFIIAILVYQFLALFGVVGALVFSRFWYRTPAFDYSDVGTISTAAHLGANPHNASLRNVVKDWKGVPGDEALGLLSARYRHTDPHSPPVIQIVATEGYESERASMLYRPHSGIM